MKLHVYIYILIFSVFLSFFQCISSDITGNTSETGNPSVVATLYNFDGSPASGVVVYIRPKSTLAKTPMVLTKISADTASTITDKNGRFTFESTLETGTYVIEAFSGKNAVFIDSVKITGRDSTILLPSVKLKPTGTLKGEITLSGGEDPRKVFVLIFGIDRFAPVKEDGSFLFENLAEANYDLRIISSLDDYEVLDTTGIIVNSDQITDLGTIKLPFSGIPIPKNLSISYDTILKIVTITWDKPVNSSVKSYNIYRRNVRFNTLFERINVNPVVDTIYKDNTIAIDTIYEYTVAAVNSENLEGNKSAVESVTVSGSYRISDTLFTADGTIQSITTDKNGKHIVYVRKKTRTTNGYSYKVERYGQNGEFLNSWDIPNSFEEMHFSNKIAVDDSGFIYVADPLNKILKFDSSGTIIKQLELSWQCDVRCLSIFKDTLYIADMFSQKVYAYSTSGDSLFSWGGKGFTDGRFENVNGIICDPSGMIYVEDFLDESRVQVFDNEGTFIRSFRSSDLGISIISSVKDSLILLTGSNMYGCDLNGTLKFAIYSVPSPVKAFLDQSNKLTVALWSGEVVHLVRN